MSAAGTSIAPLATPIGTLPPPAIVPPEPLVPSSIPKPMVPSPTTAAGPGLVAAEGVPEATATGAKACLDKWDITTGTNCGNYLKANQGMLAGIIVVSVLFFAFAALVFYRRYRRLRDMPKQATNTNA